MWHLQKGTPSQCNEKGVIRNSCNFIKKETLARVFSCEFCEISKKIFFYRTTLMAASANVLIYIPKKHQKLNVFWYFQRI